MKKQSLIVFLIILVLLLGACSMNTNRVVYMYMNGSKEITSFSAKKGETYYVDYSFTVKKGLVNLVIYHEKTQNIIFRTSMSDNSKYQGSIEIPKDGAYVVEMIGIKTSGGYAFDLYDQAHYKKMKKKKEIEHYNVMKLSQSKNEEYQLTKWEDEKNAHYTLTFQTKYTAITLYAHEGIKEEGVSSVAVGGEKGATDLVPLQDIIAITKNGSTNIHFTLPKEKVFDTISFYYIIYGENEKPVDEEPEMEQIIFRKQK